MPVDVIDTHTSAFDQYDDEAVAMFRKALSSNYDGVGEPFDNAYMSEVDKFIQKDTVMLDIGCGNGDILMSEICKATTPKSSKCPWRPKEIFAVDNSASGINAFRKQLEVADLLGGNFPKVHLVKGDMKSIGDFGIPKCDLIISRFTLHYLSSLDEIKHCLRQVKALLKPDGHLVFMLVVFESTEQSSTQAAFNLLPRGNRVPLILPPGVRLTVHGYSASEIMHAFHAIGFTIKNTVSLDGYANIVPEKHHDGEPFAKDKFPIFTMVITCMA